MNQFNLSQLSPSNFSRLTRACFRHGLSAVVLLMTMAECSSAQSRIVAATAIGPDGQPRQVQYDMETGRVVSMTEGSQSPTGDGNPSTGENGEQEFDADQFKIEQLLQLKFDRTPAAVLKAWSDELVPPRKDPSTDEPEEPKAKEELSAEQNLAAETDAKAEVADAKDAEAIEAEAKDGAETEAGEAKEAKAEVAEAEAAKEKEAAAAAAKRAEIEQQKTTILEEVKQFGRWVTLGDWNSVGEFLAKLPEDKATQVYEHLLTSVSQPPSVNRDPNRLAGLPKIVHPMQSFSPDDFIGLTDAAPAELTEKQIQQLSQILQLARDQGYVFNFLADKLLAGTKRLGGSDPQAKRLTAQLFLECQALEVAGRFLADWPAEQPIDDPLELRLLARYFDASYAADPKPELLQKSWEVHQELLRSEKLTEQQWSSALRRTVELSMLVDEEIGQQWLENSFTEDWERGVRILSEIGSAAASTMITNLANTERRKLMLTLQNKAAEKLVELSADRANQWRQTLNRLAEHWLREAELSAHLTQGSQGARMDWDRYGNFFYFDEDDPRFFGRQSRPQQPVPPADLLEIQPSSAWMEVIDNQLQPKIRMLIAGLYLKINEEEKAFPHIEYLAADQPDEALELVHEFIRTWTANHDPNNERRRFNPYMYIYGYNERAEAIPLSRSRQQRNLESLAGWVARIRQLPIKPVDETLLAAAFTTCHSSAEVFRVSAFTDVFGEIESLKPETIASLADTMRGNLASVWRQVRLQEAYQTRRKEKDVQQEVLQGYQTALQIVADAHSKFPDDWRLRVSQAALMFDENSYSQSIIPTSEFSEKRDVALAKFAEAAQAYHQKVANLDAKQRSTDPYDYWFYAALGSTDLGQVTHETLPDEKQFLLIRTAIDSLPGEAAEFHLAKFANNLFSRMNTVKPEVKHRYLKAGFDIVGDHPRARDAKKTFDYYNDVTSEIKLVAEIDGSDRIHPSQRFGVFVNLLHTPEMERESGGFEKYAQNQTQSPYYYNYGRPVEAYRDKFEKSVSKALSEHFELVSVTFENPKNMRSRPAPQSGWRLTPYAYLVLKAKGPQVDRLPPLQLNLDFMDSSGFVVLPIESPALPIDASSSQTVARPYDKLELTQTLDDRLADEGKIVLEIQATAEGLVPDLDQIAELRFDDLEIVKVDDQGAMPTEFATAGNPIRIVSDRSWMLELKAKPGVLLTEFQFVQPTVETNEITLQRYEDADLVTAANIVPLKSPLVKADLGRYLPIIILGIGLFALGLIGAVWLLKRPRQIGHQGLEMPEHINPFTVLGLLEQVGKSTGLNEKSRSELSATIHRLQQIHFAPANGSHHNHHSQVNPTGGAADSSATSTTRNGKTSDQELAQLAKEWILKSGGR